MRTLAFAALSLLSAALSARAEETKPSAPPQMSAKEQAMMEKYMKAATPGPQHERLAKLAGKWKLQVTSWMAPGGQPMKSDATAEFTSLYGGRFLQQEVKGTMPGDQTFEGRGIEGHDNVTGENFAVWVDNMGTGMMVLRGKCPADARKCTYKGTVPDAVAGKSVPITETITYTDADHFTFEMFGQAPGGKKPYKSLEIVYTRQ